LLSSSWQILLFDKINLLTSCTADHGNIQGKEDTMRRFGAFILGAAVGGLTAGIVALLFAPSSGERLRNQISDYTQEIVLEVRQAAKQKRDELEGELAQLRTPEE
jgi:hypothetical protein